MKSKLILGVFYFSSQRIDVYKNGVYVKPTNADYNQAGSMILIEPNKANFDSFMPGQASALGDNFFDRASGMAYLCVGSQPVVKLKNERLQTAFSELFYFEFFIRIILHRFGLAKLLV